MSKLLSEGSKIILTTGEEYIGANACEAFLGAACAGYTQRILKDISKGFGIGCTIGGVVVAGTIVYDYVKKKKQEKIIKEAKEVADTIKNIYSKVEEGSGEK